MFIPLQSQRGTIPQTPGRFPGIQIHFYMKVFKYLLPIVAMLLIGTSCNRDDDNEPTVDPPIEVTLRTFIVELEDTPETYKIGIDYMEQLSRMFTDAKISFDFKTTITAKVPEKDVERFLEIVNNSKYIVSVTEV
jgi:hypothetical protein